MSQNTSLTLLPIINASLRRQADGIARHNGHRLGRYRRDQQQRLRATCQECRSRLVVDESHGFISGEMVATYCGHPQDAA